MVRKATYFLRIVGWAAGLSPTTVVEAPPGWFVREDFCTLNKEKMLHSERVKKGAFEEKLKVSLHHCSFPVWWCIK